MHTEALITQIVRQTMILVAQLATTGGGRTPLAHVADQVFLSLVRNISARGVSQKVIADMFGLALRSYQQKVQRLTESSTERGRTLWEAVYSWIVERECATRGQLMTRFARDDDQTVRGIVHDLVETGLVYQTGRGATTMYRATPHDDLTRATADTATDTLAALALVVIYRHGPIAADAIAAQLQRQVDDLAPALEALVADARATRVAAGPDAPDAVLYQAATMVLPWGEGATWPAALFDHFQAMVTSVIVKLRNGKTGALPDDEVGGSTYSFDVWPGHPHEDAVRALLAETRARVGPLWDAVAAHNKTATRPTHGTRRVTFYAGQGATLDDHDPEQPAATADRQENAP